MVLSQRQLVCLEDILEKALIDKWLRCVFLIDMAGNIIANLDDGKKQFDIYSLTDFAAGNYGAVNAD